jgi:hypothetical protein
MCTQRKLARLHTLVFLNVLMQVGDLYYTKNVNTCTKVMGIISQVDTPVMALYACLIYRLI